LWLHSLKVAQLLRSAACLHTNQSRSYLNHLVFSLVRSLYWPRDELTGEWGKLHNENVNYLYSSTTIIRVMKSREIRWAGHVTRMKEQRGAYRDLVGKPVYVMLCIYTYIYICICIYIHIYVYM